jgi:YesN/AraC family two-component response regulator
MVLHGIRRRLRSMRVEWEMRFAQSGLEALHLLTQHYFDVVVTDMRMPEMDGAQLLKEVKSRYPHIVRIVLSGCSDLEMTLRSAPLAHHYLSKPADVVALKTTINFLASPRTRSVSPKIIEDEKSATCSETGFEHSTNHRCR